jgi:hypothetical protein
MGRGNIDCLLIMDKLIDKIPPNLPLPILDKKKITKGRNNSPLWKRGVRGDSQNYTTSPGPQ